VTADTGPDQGALLDHGAAIVRTSRAEVRRAGHCQRDALPGRGLGTETIDESVVEFPAQHRDDLVGVEGSRRRDEWRLELVGPADHRRMVTGVVERVLDQRFDVGRLLLDDEDAIQPPGEGANRRHVERHRHTQLQQP